MQLPTKHVRDHDTIFLTTCTVGHSCFMTSDAHLVTPRILNSRRQALASLLSPFALQQWLESEERPLICREQVTECVDQESALEAYLPVSNLGLNEYQKPFHLSLLRPLMSSCLMFVIRVVPRPMMKAVYILVFRPCHQSRLRPRLPRDSRNQTLLEIHRAPIPPTPALP